jgi:integrase
MAKYNLSWELQQLCKTHGSIGIKSGQESFSTQANRKNILNLAAKQLREGGFKNLRARGIKTKHVEHLVQRWQSEKLSPATIKNRMTSLRWWADKIGKGRMIAASNDHYSIERRDYVSSHENKARELDEDKLAQIKDPMLKMSLALQRAFGLRREESMKIQPAWAHQGDVLRLKSSWCKGGREREVPITTEAQRALIEAAKTLAGNGSLIPTGLSYYQQLKRYERQTILAGMDKNHGLRHRYARDRYLVLSARKCQKEGGMSRKEMTPEQRRADDDIRQVISRELGHERLQITSIYLGN